MPSAARPRRAPARGCRPRSRSRRAASPPRSARELVEHPARLERAGLLEQLGLQEDVAARASTRTSACGAAVADPRGRRDVVAVDTEAASRRHVTPQSGRPTGDAAARQRVSRAATSSSSGRRRSGERVLGPGAALGRGQPAALGGDRAALDAVRRRDARRAPCRRRPRRRPRRPAPGTSAPTARRRSRGTRVSTRMWFGWSSRVLLPRREDRRELVERELAVRRRDSSWRGRSDQRRGRRRARRASRPAGSCPSITVIALASAPPTTEARARTPGACCAPRCRSLQMKLARSASS